MNQYILSALYLNDYQVVTLSLAGNPLENFDVSIVTRSLRLLYLHELKDTKLPIFFFDRLRELILEQNRSWFQVVLESI